MAFISLKQFLAQLGLATPEQVTEWTKAWKIALESGSQETLLGFICRERGMTEENFLQQLASALKWPQLSFPKLNAATETRNRISTKAACQSSLLPTEVP